MSVPNWLIMQSEVLQMLSKILWPVNPFPSGKLSLEILLIAVLSYHLSIVFKVNSSFSSNFLLL